MDIKTKFSPGDTVWALKDNRIFESVVTDLIVRSSLVPDKEANIESAKTHSPTYLLRNWREEWLAENDLFPTKAELLASL